MPFKVVQTKENNATRIEVVPSNWEKDGVLFWPKQNVSFLIKDEFSIPDEENFRKLKCTLKRLCENYRDADEVAKVMENKSDTDEVEVCVDNRQRHSNYKINESQFSMPSFSENDFDNIHDGDNLMVNFLYFCFLFHIRFELYFFFF